MTQLTITPVHAEFGAKVSGVDLTARLDEALVAEIRALLDTYSFLCFPEQDMHDDAQLALTWALGAPEANHVKFGATGEIEYFGSVGNVIDAENHRGNDDPHTRYLTGNNLWHSDSSFREVPALFSINHAYEVPGEGGETEFASQRTAFERLGSEQQAELEPLEVLHDYVFSRSQVAPVDPNHAASMPPVAHRLVRTNPSNQRRNVYVGSHARTIVGWPGPKARALIDALGEETTAPEHVYAHRWAVGDTVIWDNRCLLHRGAGYDADRWRRLMRQTRVSGTGPTLEE